MQHKIRSVIQTHKPSGFGFHEWSVLGFSGRGWWVVGGFGISLVFRPHISSKKLKQTKKKTWVTDCLSPQWAQQPGKLIFGISVFQEFPLNKWIQILRELDDCSTAVAWATFLFIGCSQIHHLSCCLAIYHRAMKEKKSLQTVWCFHPQNQMSNTSCRGVKTSQCPPLYPIGRNERMFCLHSQLELWLWRRRKRVGNPQKLTNKNTQKNKTKTQDVESIMNKLFQYKYIILNISLRKADFVHKQNKTGKKTLIDAEGVASNCCGSWETLKKTWRMF